MPYYNYLGVAMRESGPEAGRLSGTSAGGETLQALAGSSSISGEGGGDVLLGSAGDNRFFITDPRDRVVEQPGGGVDTMIGYTTIRLAPNVENLIVHQNFNHAIGNSLDNLIQVDGSQWIYGAGGADVLVGSVDQRTTFLVRAGEGSDVIYNWQPNAQLRLVGYDLRTAADVRGAMSASGPDTILRLSASETLTFRGVSPADFSDRQLLLPLDVAKLGGLTFADEFNDLQILNPSTGAGQWRADFGGNLEDPWAYTLVANGEHQVYVQPGFQGRGEQNLGVNPFATANGVLSITAAPTAEQSLYATWGREYTSGMLNTLGMFEQKYGYFEMRAELPTAAGTWPAFWLLPHPYVAGVEADIMEALAIAPDIDYRRAAGGSETIYDNGFKLDAGGFHTYGMLWTPSTVTFYYDGVATLQGPTPSTWTQPMALIVNVAVGGWGGLADAAAFPSTLKVDYVRAYALSDGSTQVVREQPELPAATLRDAGAGPATNSPPVFTASGAPVTSGAIQISATSTPPATPGKTMMIWEDSGAVFGAVAEGGATGAPTVLMAGSVSQFMGSGTWLSNGKVVFGYFQPNAAGGRDAWDMVFDPAKLTFVRQDLGPANGPVTFVATANGGFAASWHAPDGQVMARGYDEFAYGGDIPGWYGPVRPISGDLTGVTAEGKLIAASPSGEPQLYVLAGATPPAAGSPPAGQMLSGPAGGGTVMGGAGADTIQGADGPNYLRGGEGDDRIVGGAAFDDINGNMGSDTLSGGLGADWVVGGKDNDLQAGDAGDDIVWGNLGADTLDGGDGADQVRGGQGDDVVRGGPGDDYVSGDRGSDTIVGGSGADVFHTFGEAGLDRVLDFSVAEHDRVMLDPGVSYSVMQIGADTVITMGGGGQMVLVGVDMASLPSGWIFS